MIQIFTKTNSKISIIIFLLFFSNPFIKSQSRNTDLYLYLSPVPNAEMVMPSTGILIRNKTAFASFTSENNSDIIVTGEKSGRHYGKLLLVEDNKILSFKPFLPFEHGEKVTVELNNHFRLLNGNYAPFLKYSFRIAEKKINLPADQLYSLESESLTNKTHKNVSNLNKIIDGNDSPNSYPAITVTHYDNPTKGYLFFTPFSLPNYPPSYYLIISDNYGVPVFYRKMNDRANDFTLQPDGYLTYYYRGTRIYYVMNSSYEIIDSLKMQNGYEVNIHDFRILDSGHYLMFAYDPEPVRMDTIVTGGNPDAIVTGLVIQELDNDKNLVFQWRSWDHFKITDATYDIDLTDSLIDCVHGNAIETDYDGNILLSSRHMDEITKINRTTGDIIWRWGGEYCKNNQFTFLNDPGGFSHQHDIRRLPNGNYTLFDNGNLHSPQYSRAVEYQMDQENKIVTLVWEHREDSLTYSRAMGSVQRLSNHNTLIGWGWQPPVADISEVRPDGTLALAIKLPSSLSSTLSTYRAYKFNWDTDFFTTDKDTLQFNVVPVGDSASVSFVLTNNSDQSVEINSVYNRDSAFGLQQQLPVVISAQGSVNFSVNFNPDTAGTYDDDMHLRWETEDQRIAKVIHLSGVTDSTYLSIVENQLPIGFLLSQNYPNPFNPVSKIKYSLPHSSLVQLRVFDVLGNEIKTLVNKEQPAGNYNVEFNGVGLPSGVYIYQIRAGEFIQTRKMILLK